MIVELTFIITAAITIIAIAITIISLAGIIHSHSEKKMKIEAALREEEMKRGYMPGTYSRSFSSKKAYRELKKQNKRAFKGAKSADDFKIHGEKEENMDREELEKAISDLERRINNLDTIMREKRNGR